MCLIVYSPEGELMPRDVHDRARNENPDGIGVMSESGVKRFLGRGAGKRAWRHIRKLAERGEPYGVHYRWATHGAVALRNTHPFQGGAEGRVHVMHNGIIDLTADDATPEVSDTVLFVREWMQQAPDPVAGVDCKAYYNHVETLIGRDNKLLVMGESGVFRLVNEFAGFWVGGFWYSNEYSLASFTTRKVYTATAYTPACVLDLEEEEEDEGNWRVVDRRAMRVAELLDYKEEYECRGCGTLYREEELWAMEECQYCGTMRAAS